MRVSASCRSAVPARSFSIGSPLGSVGGASRSAALRATSYVTLFDVTFASVSLVSCRTVPRSRASGFVIEELSRRTGMTVRSLRSYQSRKLLPPPTVRGRTGYYDERHVARIQLIQNLQSEGVKLQSIARMLDEGGRSDADLLQFTRSVQTMFTESGGAITTIGDLAARFGIDDLEAGAHMLERAERLGLVRHVSDDSFEELSPRLIAVGETAVRALGLTADEALDVVGKLRKHADGVAKIYLDLFVTNVWTPFAEATSPPSSGPTCSGRSTRSARSPPRR